MTSASSKRFSGSRAIFASHWLYLAWGLASAAVLSVAAYVDPYIFGFSAFGAAAVSGLITAGAAASSWRNLPWALAAALPTGVAFLRLSTYSWV